MYIAIDFDGTCVTHEYPKVGRTVENSVNVIKRLVRNGHQIILWTMRSGKELRDAEKWFADNEIPLFGSNKNPTQASWSNSPKAYAHHYIDDAAIGVPLIYEKHERPYVNWEDVEKELEKKLIVLKELF